MPDDPNKKHIDSWFVSSQPHEYQFFKARITSYAPGKSEEEIANAILTCRKSLAPSEGRAKLTECVKRRLGI